MSLCLWQYGGVLFCTAIVLSNIKLKGLLKMKKYKIIGLTIWTIANILLIKRRWDYLPIAPLFTVQIIISVCCSILFCIEFSSKAMRIVENGIMVFLIVLALCYIIKLLFQYSAGIKLCAFIFVSNHISATLFISSL